jgi:hypothetical protein
MRREMKRYQRCERCNDLKTAQRFESDERSAHHLADARGGSLRIGDQILEL